MYYDENDKKQPFYPQLLISLSADRNIVSNWGMQFSLH